MDEKKRRRRGSPGREKLPPEERRGHCVSVRLNADELARLDNSRAAVGMQRGEYLRAAALDVLPPTIAPINRQAWADLGRALGNLSTVATAMRDGEYIMLVEVEAAVREVRNYLIGVRP